MIQILSIKFNKEQVQVILITDISRATIVLIKKTPHPHVTTPLCHHTPMSPHPTSSSSSLETLTKQNY